MHTVIIGASHAGSQAAISLRQSGYEGDITLIGDESDLPYHRPPLSKDYLSGVKSIEDIYLRPSSVYETANIKLLLRTRVESLDVTNKLLKTDANQTLNYDKLILATGARVRPLAIEGVDNSGVYYLRDAKDVRAIMEASKPGSRAVIIGGGYIGLETAASLRKQGLEVTVLEAMERILQRITASVMSDFYRRVHSEEGVTIHEGVMASEITQNGGSLEVHTKQDQTFEADIVIIGIGVIPNTELAKEAGLEVGNGIIVNEFCQTSNTDIYAIGDVSWHTNPIYGYELRLESVPNATEQAKTAALHISDKPKPYNSLPWFWSDQFDLKLQIAGLSQGYEDIIIRGDNEKGRSFAAYYFLGEKLLAVDAVNSPRDFMFAKMTLTKGQAVDKAKLSDVDTDLKATLIV